jgi:GntR family transcriptional regulator
MNPESGPLQTCLPKIDRRSPIPFYVQLIDALKKYIAQGGLQAGDKLPSEMELCAAFDISRTVVRQALQGLENDGIIARAKGKGAFVAQSKISESLVQRLTGFHQDMTSLGYEPVSRILKQEVVPAEAAIAERLRLTVGAPVIEITRVRSIEEEPIVLVTTYLPHQLCRGIEFEDLRRQSLYDVLEMKCGLRIARGERTISATIANDYTAELLNVRKGAPLVTLESVSYLSDDTPLEYYHAFHRADRSQFKVELVRFRERGNHRIPLFDHDLNIPASHQHAR